MINRLHRVLLLGALRTSIVLSIVAMDASAAEQDQFKVYELSVEGWALGSLVGDFNGDNLGDVALIYLPTQSQDERRFIGLFLQDKARGYDNRPAHITPLPSGASQFQVIDVDNDGKQEIVFIDHQGVQTMRWEHSRGFQSSVRLARRETIYRVGDFRGAIVSDFAFELNGLPSPEFIAPTPGGMAIFESGEDGAFDLLNEVELLSRGRHTRRSLGFFRRNQHRSYLIESPRVFALDANIDGRTDLYFVWSDRVFLFLQDESGAYPRSPDARVALEPVTWEGECNATVADCNGDNRPDIVALRTHGGIASAECLVDFYLADATGKPSAKPQKTLTISQARASMLLSDVDGDRIPELALTAVELGTVSTIKMMMQRKGGLYLLIYPLRGGLPADEASVRKKLDFALNYDMQSPDQEILFDWSADYNDDGLRDMAYTDGGGHLEIYYGSSTDYLEKSAGVEVQIPDAADLRSLELNRDGRSDLLIERTNSGRVNGVWALLSATGQ